MGKPCPKYASEFKRQVVPLYEGGEPPTPRWREIDVDSSRRHERWPESLSMKKDSYLGVAG